MAVKIKLKRMGKIRNPQYRIIVADARTKRDGRAIEQIGKYHPKEEPSLIDVDSARAQYWLGVGAQPTEPVLALLKVTGDWQKFKGLPGAEGTLKVKEARRQASTLRCGARPSSRRGAARSHDTEEADPEGCRREAGRGRHRIRCRAGSRTRSRNGREDRRHRRRGLRTLLAEALEHLVRGIVEHPDDVHVRSREQRRGRSLEVRVHPDDLGKVIGRGGRTATAFRTVLGALAGSGVRIDFVAVDGR